MGGFIGCAEDNSGTTAFTSCTSTATVIANSNRVSPFVGQAYSNGTYTFNQCTLSGWFFGSSGYNGGFMSVAGGSYYDAEKDVTTRKTAKVTFTGCEADIFMVGGAQVAPYVGSNYGGTPTVKFDNCKSKATIYTKSSAGSWIAQSDGSGANATVTWTNNCTSNVTIYSNTLYKDDTATWTKVASGEVSCGAFAYTIAQAQKAAGITNPAYLYGQEIGVDAAPVVGGKTVYKVPLPQSDPVYTNDATAAKHSVLDTGNGIYHQTSKSGNMINDRIIIPIKEEKLITLDGLNIEVVYTLTNGSTKTLKVTPNQLTTLLSVYAGDEVVMAPAGYVLLAITVKNIPDTQWDGEAVSVMP